MNSHVRWGDVIMYRMRSIVDCDHNLNNGSPMTRSIPVVTPTGNATPNPTVLNFRIIEEIL